MDYFDSLGRGWQIAWKNKGLWLLGILAGCATGEQGSPDFNFSNNFNSSGSGPSRGDGAEILAQMQNYLEQNMTLVITIGVVVLVAMVALGVVSLVLGFIGRGGLLKGAQLAQANGQVSLGEAFGAGREQLGRLFSLWLFTDLPFTLLGLGVAVGAIFFVLSIFTTPPSNMDELMQTLLPIGACLVPLVCLMALANLFARILNHMGTLTAVFEEQSGLTALQSGFAALRANFLPYTLIAVILWVLRGIISVVLGLPMIFIALPVFFAVVAGAANDEPMGGALAGMAVAGVCFVAYLPVLLLGQGIFHTWAYATWADLYQRLRGAGPAAVAPTPAPDYSGPIG